MIEQFHVSASVFCHHCVKSQIGRRQANALFCGKQLMLFPVNDQAWRLKRFAGCFDHFRKRCAALLQAFRQAVA